MAPNHLKQMVYFSPGYDSMTWWCRLRIKKYGMSLVCKGFIATAEKDEYNTTVYKSLSNTGPITSHHPM